MSDNSSSSTPPVGGGVGFVGFLTLLFIALKLLNVIDWSWWWVLSPMLISVALGVLFAVGVVLAAVIRSFSK